MPRRRNSRPSQIAAAKLPPPDSKTTADPSRFRPFAKSANCCGVSFVMVPLAETHSRQFCLHSFAGPSLAQSNLICCGSPVAPCAGADVGQPSAAQRAKAPITRVNCRGWVHWLAMLKFLSQKIDGTRPSRFFEPYDLPPLKRREPSVSPAAARITLHEHSRRPEGGAASCLPGFDAGKTNPPTRCGFRACPSIMVRNFCCRAQQQVHALSRHAP